MADDDDTKRVNVLIPRDLYERFLEFSKGEYKSTTGMIVEWMSTFVREKEREAQDKQAFLLAFSKFGQLLFNLGSSKAVGEEAGDLLKELSAALLELVRDPALCSSSDFSSRLIILEQRIQRHITSV